VGTARSAETREIAREIGLCDRIVDTAAEAVEGADLVVLCVPVGVMGPWRGRSRRTSRPARR
jgi:cyclohexadieny/prephenate dehydrogenase